MLAAEGTRVGIVVVLALLLAAWWVDARRARRPVPPPLPINFPLEVKRQVLERAKGKCEYCGVRVSWGKPGPLAFRRQFNCDHVNPIARGGRGVLGNGAAACSECNGMKYEKTFDDFAAEFRVKHGRSPGVPRVMRG